MKSHCFHPALFALATIALVAFAAPSRGEAEAGYPNRTIKLIVPAPAGGVLDALARIVGEKLAAKWGQTVIVENQPGAAHNIGAEAVASADPDGHTLLVTPPAPLVTNRWLQPKLAFDPAAFVPITILVKFSPVVVVHPKVPVSTFREFIAYARENPDKVTYASPGTGSTPQLAMEELARLSGIRLVHVPHQGLPPAQRDLLGGHVDSMIDLGGNSLSLIKEGQLKVLAVTSKVRAAELPEVPTVAEFLPEFSFVDWFAMMAPPRTPIEIADKLSQTVRGVLGLSDVAERLRKFSVTPVASSPTETAAFLKHESEHWRQVIDRMRTKPQ
jgi:tripartite-type tricarboxylate transporter receptor subunit TctC